MHFASVPGNEKNIEKLTKMVGANKITAQLGEDEEKNDRYEVFEAVDALTCAARDLYCHGEMEFNDMLKELVAALTKLKGKEKELITIEKQAKKTEAPNES